VIDTVSVVTLALTLSRIVLGFWGGIVTARASEADHGREGWSGLAAVIEALERRL
jgi:hypothetical protein